MNTAIRVSNLTKTYRIYSGRRLLAAQAFQLLTRNLQGQLLYALQDVSFEVAKGEIFGIIGHNGSGKSTLLKILSGITRADSGAIDIRGRVTSLLELGVGFEPELTGRENIYLYASLLGLQRSWVENQEENIIKFSGIRNFIDSPVKSYSSGMLIRLAFATAVHTDPDILLLDEVLGVGDTEFQHRSFQAIQKAVERGVTVLIVSHGLTFVGNFCSRVMCLNQGRIAGIGLPEQVVHTYMDSISVREKICEIGHGELRVSFLPAGFHIERSGILYTIARGVSVNLRKWDADFMSSEAAWSVIDLKDDEVWLRLRWGHWNLEMEWHIRIPDESSIEWTIENGPNLHLDVDNLEIEAMVSGSYRTYILPEEIRAFPGTVNRGFNMEYLLAQQQPRRFLGVAAGSEDQSALILDFTESPATGSSMIITGGNLMPGHILKRSFAAQPDQEPIRTRIHLFNELDLADFRRKNQQSREVKSKGLELKLESGCLMLYRDGTLLTRAPGLFTLPNPNSRQIRLDWELIDTVTGLHLRATDLDSPLVSIWKIEATDCGLLWSLDIEFLEHMDIHEIPIYFPLVSGPEDSPDIGMITRWDPESRSLIAVTALPESVQTPSRIHAGSGLITDGAH